MPGFYQSSVFDTFPDLRSRIYRDGRPAITSTTSGADKRRADLDAWLTEVGSGKEVVLERASDDASFRRYYRWQVDGRRLIVMDAPPAEEDCLPFVRVAGYLEAMQLNAPRILEADLERGFLLLSDLGERSYLDALRADPDDADALYRDAIDALLVMQRRGAVYQASLPDYDAELLEFELSLFRDWLCRRYLDLDWSDADEAGWSELRSLLVHNALDQPQRFVHRDYHSRNLMQTDVANPGILDFQDAVEGPLTYDLVSLLKDCYIAWPESKIDAWVRYFYDRLDEQTQQNIDAAVFRRHLDLTGVQRHLKAAGIFARLDIRDGKSAYLADIPRTLGYVTALASRYDELDFIIDLIDARVLPALEAGR